MRKKVIALMVAVSLCLTIAIPVAETLADSVEETSVPNVEGDTQEVSNPAAEPAPAEESEEEETVETPAEEPAAVEEPAEEEQIFVDEPTIEEASEEQQDEEQQPIETEEPAEAAEESVSDMEIALSGVSLYVLQGKAAHVTLTVIGGCAPYTVAYGEQTMELESEGENVLSFTAEEGGELRLSVTVTDANGAVCTASAVVPVSVEDKGDADEYLQKAKALKKELTGEWHEDILMMARSQIGYRESSENFVILDSEKGKQGYTLYGNMAGMPYEEWCAMFVSACAEFADIPDQAFPVFSSQKRWIASLKTNGAYENDTDAYTPVPGDLIFFSWNGDKNDSDHIGIVEKVDSEYVYTIEGNSARSVRNRSYKRNDTCIIGYGNLWKLMEKAGIRISEYEDAEDAVMQVRADTVLRAHETVCSAALAKIRSGEELTVLGKAVRKNGEIWWKVQFGEKTGYIRNDGMENPGEESEPAETEEEQSGTDETVMTGKVIVDMARLRTAPTTDDAIGQIIGKFPRNTEMTIIDRQECEDGVWYEVEIGDITGWIRGDLVEVTENAAEEPDERAQAIAAWVEEVNATEEMIERAMNAKSLDSVVLEGDRLIYVRTGETLASYDAESGAIIDVETGIKVAEYVDGILKFPVEFESAK